MKSDKHTLNNNSQSSNRKKNVGPGQFDMLETLEPRLLLTTVSIGGTFEFEDSRGVADQGVIVSLEDDTPGSTAEVVLLNADGLDIVDGDDISSITVNNATAGTVLKILSHNANPDPGDPSVLPLGGGGQAVYNYGADGAPGGAGADADVLCPTGTGGVRITGAVTTDGPMGQMIINGTVLTGIVNLGGSTGFFYCGYLEASVGVIGDLDRLLVATDVGAGDPSDPDSVTGGLIIVLGSVKNIDIGGDMYKSITTDGIVGVIEIGGTMYEDIDIATAPDPAPPGTGIYEEQEIVDPTLAGSDTSPGRNDTAATAEQVASLSGDVTISGNMEGYLEVGTPVVVYTDYIDCYSLTLEAGKEVRIVQATAEDITFALIDTDGTTWIGYGGGFDEIVWTPDVNGQYVLAVSNLYEEVDVGLVGSELGFFGTYEIDVTGMAEVALGAMLVGGNIGNSSTHTGPTFTVVTGNAGVISANGSIVATTIDIQSGSLSQLKAANFIDGIDVTVLSDIGLISGANLDFGNFNAGQDIEEIRFTGNFSDQKVNTIISADRHVGQVIIGGNMIAVDIFANGDGVGDPGYIDLVDVGGDMGSLSDGYVTLQAGLGGDVRFVRVAGTVYTSEGGWIGPRSPIVVDTSSDPDVLRIVDDNGSVLNLGLGTGATASYLTLPIEGGVGVAIINLTVTGDINLDSAGAVQIGQLEFTPGAASDSLRMTGTDRFDVFYLKQTGTADKIINSTEGSIVSAELGTANVFRVTGNIGDSAFDSGVSAFIHGHLTISTNPGGGELDGIRSSGDLGSVRANGSVRDLVCGGTLGELIVNADGYTPADEFHGINGFIYGNEIGTINVGDGVLPCPFSQHAEVGIYSSTTIGNVIADGINTVIEAPIIAETEITRITASGGASLVGLIEGGILADYTNGTVNGPKEFGGIGGHIGIISLSGAGTNITDAWVIAYGIDEISASGGTDGMVGTEVRAEHDGVGNVLMDGPGIIESRIVSGAGISAVKATAATGVIGYTIIYAVTNIGHVSAYDIIGYGFQDIPEYSDWSDIAAENTVKKITAKNDLTDMKFACGGFGTMTVAGDMDNIWLEAAGPIVSINVTGQAEGDIISKGPFANVKEIVTGPMDMTIISEGKVGKIITTAGNDMDLDLTISGENASLTKLKSGGYMHGDFIIGGPAGQIIAYGELATAGQLIYVDGDVDEISTRMPTGGGAVDIAANIVVNGRLKLLDSAAGITGRVQASEGISRIYADGDVTGEIVSSHFINYINVYGGDLIGTVTAMSDIKSVRVEAIGGVGGNITGDITSTAGSVLNVHAKGGNAAGNILAEQNVSTVRSTSVAGVGGDVIGNTQAVLGKVGTVKSVGGDITGNVQAYMNVEKVETTDGQIAGDITSDAGSILTVYSSGGDVSGTLTAAVDIRSVRGVTSATGATGHISGDLIAGRDIRDVYNRGGDLTGTVVAGRNINKVNIRGSGDVTGNIQAGGKIGFLNADTVTGATVAAGTDITRIRVYGNVDESYFLAGYNTGADLAVGGGDDVLTGGNVGGEKAEFIGNFISSVLAAGVGPGADGLFGTGDDELAAGESSITKVRIIGAVVDGAWASYGIFADTSVGSVKEAGIILPDGYADGNFKVHSIDGADIVPVGTFFFDADNPLTLTDIADGDTVTITLTGPGNGTVTTDTGNHLSNNIDVIQLDGVTSAESKLIIKVKTPGGANGDFSANLIEMGDDDGLRRLLMPYLDLNGLAGVGVNMDGNLKKMQVADVADGAALNIGGDLKVLSARDVGNTNITVGGVAGTLTMDSYAAGVLTARDLTALTVESGALGADVNVTGGSGKTEIAVTGGDATGNVTTRYNLAKLRVASAGGVGGEIIGNVTSTSGSITRVVAIGGDLTGNVDAATLIGTVRVKASGGLGGTMTGNVTAGTSIGTVKVSDGDLTGDVTAGGGIDLLAASRGNIDGATVLAKGRIRELLIIDGDMTGATVASRLKVKSASMVNMTNSLLSAGTDMDLFRTSGNVDDSNVLSGYWIGDDGAFDSGDDELGSGTITKAVVGVDMTGSSFAAGVGTGVDGYFGTDDDTALEGVSSITRLAVRGAAFDDGAPGVYDGVVAATSLGRITYSGVELGTTGNLTVATRPNAAGGPRVLRVQHSNDKVIIKLSEGVLPETLNDLTFLLDGSGSGPLVADSITFDPDTLEATFDYGAAFPGGETIAVSLLGDGANTVQDRGGVSLDGDYSGTLPSGDGIAGGDFVAPFST